MNDTSSLQPIIDRLDQISGRLDRLESSQQPGQAQESATTFSQAASQGGNPSAGASSEGSFAQTAASSKPWSQESLQSLWARLPTSAVWIGAGLLALWIVFD